MTTIIAVQRKIRRALQLPLYAAAVAAGLVNADGEPLIQWNGVPFDRRGLPKYISVEIGFGAVIIHEIGPNPQVEGRGHVTMNLHSPIDEGEDSNDALLGIVVTAYPYNSNPSFEGVSVHVDKTEPRGYGRDEPWLTGLYATSWDIYRRNT